MATCEDYPCCGHTDGLGCDWTYTPEAQAFDMAHAMCDHEAGVCDAYDDDEPDEDDDDYDGAPYYRDGMGPGDPVRCDND